MEIKIKNEEELDSMIESMKKIKETNMFPAVLVIPYNSKEEIEASL